MYLYAHILMCVIYRIGKLKYIYIGIFLATIDRERKTPIMFLFWFNNKYIVFTIFPIFVVYKDVIWQIHNARLNGSTLQDLIPLVESEIYIFSE